MVNLDAYIGRDNVERLRLKQGSSVVLPGATIRAAMTFGAHYCLDTDNAEHADLIFFDDEDNQILGLRLGRVPDLAIPEGGGRRGLQGKLTLWDGTTDVGFAWDEVSISVQEWPVCNGGGE